MPQRKNIKKVETGEKTEESLFVVGMGASAGGLEPIQSFFSNFTDGYNTAFVIVEHLSHDYKSMLPDLLAKHTDLPVANVRNKMRIEPGKIYIMPGGKSLTLKKGLFVLSERRHKTHDFPIDAFLNSIAEEYNDHSIGIILSGTGTDGTAGIKAIKEAGGMVMAQEPGSAKFDGMPNSAIALEIIDHILTPEDLAAKLINYLDFFPIIKKNPVTEKSEDQKTLDQILTLVRQKTNHNFYYYKYPTLLRRIARRMALKGIRSLQSYQEYLQRHDDEIRALSKDFLIGVTRFFRDKAAFDTIRKKVIPELLNRRVSGDTMKAWSIGCSTGEEAYTIAILFKECIKRSKKDLTVKIFATDIDEDSIMVASKGIYPLNIEADVDPEFLSTYFNRKENVYQIKEEIRRMVIFSKHNVAEDPPFHRVHFVSCRNVLIYMKSELQQKVFSRIHFGLNLNGYLMLGSNEALGEMESNFIAEDKKWKIFKNKESGRTISQDFTHLTNHDVAQKNWQFTQSQPLQELMKDHKLAASVNELLFEHYDLACISVDKNYNVQQALGNYYKYLKLPKKQFSTNLLKMVYPDLAVAVGTAVRKAMKDEKTVVYNNVKYIQDDNSKTISLFAQPIKGNNGVQTDCLIVFKEESIEKVSPISAEEFDKVSKTDQRINDLEQELLYTKESLQSTVEEFETSNEELQSSNEELLAANEELQSTNEELQSVNEELNTVNTEHQEKIEQLAQLNDDMDNLLKSTHIGTLFVDLDLKIRKFTPAIKEHLNLIDADIGRPIRHITTNFKGQHDLSSEIEKVINRLKPFQRDIMMQDDKWYLMNILPYVTKNKIIKGAVITFVDIDDLRKTKDELENKNKQLTNEIEQRISLEETNELLLTINRKVNQAQDFKSCLHEVLRHLIDLYQLDLGIAWLHNEERDTMSPFESCIAESEGKHYWQEGKDFEFVKGQGLVGRIWKMGKAEWIEDVATVETHRFYRKKLADKHHFHSIFGFPVIGKGSVEMVLTFYSSRIVKNGTELVELIGNVLNNLSPLLRKQKLQEELRTANQQLKEVAAHLQTKSGQLQETHEKWTSLINNTPDIIALVDRDLKLQFINHVKPTLRKAGWTKQKITGKGFTELLAKPEREEMKKKLQEALRGKAVQTHSIIAKKDYEMRLVPLKGIKKVTGLIIIATDITERIETEKRLREEREKLSKSEDRFRTLADNAPVMIWQCDANMKFDFFNKVWKEYTGKSRIRNSKNRWKSLVHPEDRKDFDKTFDHAIKDKKQFRSEYRLKKQNGEYRWVHEKGVPRFDDGNFLGFIGTCMDIHATKVLNEKKDQFIGIASHELKTPLASLKAYMQLIEDLVKERKDTPDMMSFLTKALSGIDKLENLISDLLDVSKIQAGRLRFKKHTLDLDQFIYSIVDAHMPNSKNKIVIKGKTNKKIKGDPDRLEQVFYNLFTNAEKFSPKNKNIEISLSSADHGVKIAVKDQGPGIAPDKLSFIFDQFYQIEDYGKSGGLGLGLYISKQIVERHQGNIWAESKTGKGTTFFIELPESKTK